MAMLAVNGWILHLSLTPCSSVPLLSVGPCLHLFLCLSPLLTTPFIHNLVWPFSYRQSLPPTPDTCHFRCSYCLHPSHAFLSTWGAIVLETQKKKKEKKGERKKAWRAAGTSKESQEWLVKQRERDRAPGLLIMSSHLYVLWRAKTLHLIIHVKWVCAIHTFGKQSNYYQCHCS